MLQILLLASLVVEGQGIQNAASCNDRDILCASCKSLNKCFQLYAGNNTDALFDLTLKLVCTELEKCDKEPRCTGGKVYSECYGHCKPTCNKTECNVLDRSCTGGCVCPKEKPIHHEGECITQDKCPVEEETKCKTPFVYKTCGKDCKQTCDDPNPTCNKMCEGGCACPTEKPIHHEGECITQDKCHVEEDIPCPGGKVYSECNGHCNPTCDDREPVCDRMCTGGCVCPDGTYYHEGECITEDKCPVEEVKKCSPGNYKSGDTCTECPQNTYSESSDETQCTKCPRGKVSSPGSNSASQCVWAPCNPGYFATSEGCKPCSQNTYSDASASSCSVCLPGTFSDVASSQCESCAAGTYRGVSDNMCILCKVNTFSSSGAASCTACSDGYRSDSGSSECTKECVDEDVNCKRHKEYSGCKGSYENYMKINCKKTCQLCGCSGGNTHCNE